MHFERQIVTQQDPCICTIVMSTTELRSHNHLINNLNRESRIFYTFFIVINFIIIMTDVPVYGVCSTI